METQGRRPFHTHIHEQGAQLRCHVCGSPDIAVMCHHCGRPMCAHHGPVHPLLHRLWSWGGLAERREFAGLTLDVWPLSRARPAHCEFCAHCQPDYRYLMIGPGAVALLVGMCLLLAAAVGLGTCLTRTPQFFEANLDQAGWVGQNVPPLGLAEVLRDPAVYERLPAERCYQPVLARRLWQVLRAWLLVVFGAITAVLGIYLNRQQAAAVLAGGQVASSPGVILSGERMAADSAGGYPPVPLGPVTDCLEIRETLCAKIILDEAGRSVARLAQPLQGDVNPRLHFTARDRQRVAEYRAKYGLKREDYIAFRAGYLALEGRPLLHFAMRPSRRTVFWLSGQVNEHKYLDDETASLPSASWPIKWQYTVPLDDDERDGWNAVPVRLVPLPVEMGNARRLHVEVQFDPAEFPFLGPGQLLVLEEVQLELDRERLGRPQTTGVVAEDEQQAVYRVKWQSLQFPAGVGITRFCLPELQFARPVQPDAHLKGRLRLRVPALRSGLSGVRYFSALGYPVGAQEETRAAFPARGNTYFEVEFDLALAHLPQAELVTLNWMMNAQSAPAPVQVRRLLDALNVDPASGSVAQNTCLQQVVESPPYGADGGHWHWDIWGRRYHHTLPVDFHLVVYGQAGPHGKSRVEVSVQGQAFDPSSQQAVGDTLTELRQRIIETMV